MSRTQLLGAASAAALSCFSVAHAASVMNGGGSTLAQFEYIDEFSIFNAATTTATFGSYWESGSGAGQKGFLNDDLTCDINKVQNLNSGNCSNTPGGANATVYGASDATLCDAADNAFCGSSQITPWATYQYGQALSGDLIQLPAMGVGISFPVTNSAVVNNGDASLSDSDLCGIFSGLITDFSQITDAVTLTKAKTHFAAGSIQVIYRGDGSGTSFLLTNHLASVCTAANTQAGFNFYPTTTFASLFGGTFGSHTNPGSHATNTNSLVYVSSGLTNGASNVYKGSSGVASGTEATADAIAYLSPDFTTVDPNSDATVNGAPSTLVVASALNGKTPNLPTTTAITAGLAHPKAGTGYATLPPSTATQGADPTNWVPLTPVVTSGYPVVGYTTWLFAQCYADKTVTSGVLTFLKDHYTNATYTNNQKKNGFVGIANSGAAKFILAIENHILANKVVSGQGAAWNEDIGDKTVCAGIGR